MSVFCAKVQLFFIAAKFNAIIDFNAIGGVHVNIFVIRQTDVMARKAFGSGLRNGITPYARYQQ